MLEMIKMSGIKPMFRTFTRKRASELDGWMRGWNMEWNFLTALIFNAVIAFYGIQWEWELLHKSEIQAHFLSTHK
jgi:hypothetical protein